jgi:hypothetical protein
MAAKKGAILAATWFSPDAVLVRAFPSCRDGVPSERPAVKGAPVLGAAKRTLESEDRSETIGRQGKAREPLAKGGPAKMAPSLTALNMPA